MKKEKNKLKLINSLTEHKIREGLIHSKQRFFGSEKGAKIIAALEASLGKIRDVCMTH